MNTTVSHELWIPMNRRKSDAAAIGINATSLPAESAIAEATRTVCTTSGNAVCHNQSSSTGLYPLCIRARRRTIASYNKPPSPTAPIASAALKSACQGVVMIAANSNTVPKWTIVGVANAPSAESDLRTRLSAMRATTTN